MKSRTVYTIIFYLSILFAFIYVFKHSDGNIDLIRFNSDLSISLLLLTLGFLIYPYLLHKILKYHNIVSSYPLCLTSLGKTIFSKYIPGKIAMIYAIAYNLKIKKDSENFGKLFIYVLIFQVYIIIGGIITGLFSVFQINGISFYLKTGSLAIIILMFILLNSEFFFNKFTKLVSKKVKNRFTIQHFNIVQIINLTALSVLFWLLWGLGIYFFIHSIGLKFEDMLLVIFFFPFSVCIGILAFVTPGGLGVREGIFVTFLTALGVTVITATKITLLSRIWFICGELIFFSISSAFAYLYNNKSEEKE